MIELSQQKNAVTWLRILYPLWAAVGMFSIMYVPSVLIVKGNALLTVENIVNQEYLFRIGIAGSLLTQLISIPVIWCLYRLFFTSYKEAVVLTGLFNFLGMPITMVSVARQMAALDVLDSPEQVMLLLSQETHGTMVATIFWGLWLLPIGYMVIKSPLFPRAIGWLLYVSGGAYTLSAFLYFLGYKGTPVMQWMEYLTIGELIWMLWVVFLGARWKKLEAI